MICICVRWNALHAMAAATLSSAHSVSAQRQLSVGPRQPFAMQGRVSVVNWRCDAAREGQVELSRKEAHHARKKEEWKKARRIRKREEVRKAITAQLQKIHQELRWKLSPQKTNELKGRIRALLKQIQQAGLQNKFQGLDAIDLSRVGEGQPRVVKDVWLERRSGDTGGAASHVWVRTAEEGESRDGGGGDGEAGMEGREGSREPRIGVRLGRDGRMRAKVVGGAGAGAGAGARAVVDWEPIAPRVGKPVEEADQVQWLAHSLNCAPARLRRVHLSRLMHSARLKLTDARLLELVRMLAELGNWRRAMLAVDWVYARQHSRYSKSRFVLTTLLAVLGRARRPLEASRVFDVMLESPSAYPDMAAYRSIAVTLGQAGCLRQLLALVERLRQGADSRILRVVHLDDDGRLQPDVVVYNALLNACAVRGQWKGAQWVLDRMSKEGVNPNSATFGLAIEVTVKGEQVELAVNYYNRMERGGFHPNFLTIKALVQACGLSGNADLAVELVEDMKFRGIVAGASLYYTLACTLCRCGRWRDALLQIEKTKHLASRKDDVVTYTGLIRACGEAGLWQDAVDVFDHMRTVCPPNIGTFNVMIGVYGRNKLFSAAMALYEGIRKGVFVQSKLHRNHPRLSPDDFTYEAVLGACVRSAEWDAFEEIYAAARLHGFQLDSQRHTWLVTSISRANKVDLVKSIFMHLEESRQVPSLQMYQQQMSACYRAGKFRQVLLLLNQMSSHMISMTRLEWNTVLGLPTEPITSAHIEDFILQLCSVKEPEDQTLLDKVRECMRSIFAGPEPEERPSSQQLGTNGKASFPDLVLEEGRQLRSAPQEPANGLWCDELSLFAPRNFTDEPSFQPSV